jgi:kynurenine formamidase
MAVVLTVGAVPAFPADDGTGSLPDALTVLRAHRFHVGQWGTHAGLNHYQVELLANLDRVPEAGGLVWVTPPKVEDGAGFHARVIAIVP